MLKKIRHDALYALGLTVWLPRTFRHPLTSAQDLPIIPQNICINARCLVLLYNQQRQENFLNPAEQKILTGMLSVLDLPITDIMRATVYGGQPDFDLMRQQVAEWRPQYVLQLAKEIPAVRSSTNFFQTFSPQHLANNPADKAAAHHILKSLRRTLHACAYHNA